MARNFKRISANEYLARFDDRSPQPQPAAHIAEVAAEYGIPTSDIQLIETATDLRNLVTMIKPPPDPAVVADTNEKNAIKALRDKAAAGVITPVETADFLKRLYDRLLAGKGL